MKLTKTYAVLFSLPACALLLPLQVATQVAHSAEPQVNAGKTIVARGRVIARQNARERPLKRRSPVYVQDTVSTGALSNTQIRMADGGLLSLQPHTQVAILDYQVNQKNKADSVSIELLKGGLRTVTGALKSSSKQYKMKTPVASIGVRGTHYEVEMNKGSLFLAVWQGNIDVQVTTGSQPQSFSLGHDEANAFAQVLPDGAVNFTLEVPKVFTRGHSKAIPAAAANEEESQEEAPAEENQSEQAQTAQGTDKQEQTASTGTSPASGTGESDNQGAAASSAPPAQSQEQTQELALGVSDPLDTGAPEASYGSDIDPEFDLSGESWVDNDETWGSLEPTSPEVIASRSGQVEFNQLSEFNLTGSAGEFSDLNLSMSINFDTARVTQGQLSFSDNGGEWFAAFNGIIGTQELEMKVNFASHGNALAEGEINGLLLNNASEIIGDFSLAEQENSTVNAAGSYLLSETP
ncbi:FecR family protein [Thalassomonas actiniarum]|uniref:FecR domain-containing protein n=1 Tax=Thalassomonas actiniarum TaxID=485447 RepID=A0AAF0C4F2_9GAMM|nr:FecR family protein [Thalassomonas actiniarum]WDD99759.1 FecR domain-containing protein [Thalassomonas actiniarum]